MVFSKTLDEEIKNHNEYGDRPEFVSSDNILTSIGESLKNTYELSNAYFDKIDNVYSYNRYQNNDNVITDELNDETDNAFEKLNQLNTDLSNAIVSSSDYIKSRVEYSKNQYKNQKLMSDTIEEEKNIVDTRNKKLLNDIALSKKGILTNTYQHKKYKTQTDILYFIIKVSLLVIVLSLLNEYVSFFPETLYVILVGIIFGVSFIHILYRLYDIMIRDELVFDEYNLGRMGVSSKDFIPEDKIETKSTPNCNNIKLENS